MTDHAPAAPGPGERPLRPVWIWLALIFTALCVIQGGHQMWQSSGLPTGLSRVGLNPGACAGTTYCRIEAVQPGSPAHKAGIRAGDMIAVERPLDFRRALAPGDTRTYLRLEPTGERRITITGQSRLGQPIPEYVVSSIILMLAGVMGGLVIARSEGRRAVVLIGLAYASYAITGQWPRLWQALGDLYAWFYVVLTVIYYGSPLLFLAGARALRQEVSGRDPIGMGLAFWALIAAQGALLAWQLHAEITGREGLFGDNAFLAYTLPVFIGYALAAVVLALAWREAPPEARSRYGMMLIAIGATFLSGVFDMGILITGNDYTSISPLLIAWYVAFVGGTALFGYAILRHRVVDLGFAVNRTLVYGVLSSTLLFTFFFLEWGAEQVIPSGMREASLLVSAGIALILFLVFERIRHWVEGAIETLFFRSWRENEARLRRFLKDSAFMGRAETLRTAAVAEIRRFSGGAETALYGIEPTGAVLNEGGLRGGVAKLDLDDPALVRLRADREPIQDETAAGLGAVLILPMMQRLEVIGFIALGPKPCGEDYRPDETALLVEAAAKVGLDLHALQVEELRRQVGTLDAQLKMALGMARKPVLT
ncbi:PDZ domain-containing protein [Brevundimonas lenta]|uniref:MFS family permease n=1 Tax=Brevundimonas lenta TaxID=424796 RepID=A0A7W6JC09_9CAUL|nr:PDZ domain-containing protein [Brevundimonas lenta]MBB4082358.1 MFS family permease [Brevundimonas lenta]